MIETKESIKIQSLEAEINQLNQKLLDKDKQLEKAESKLKRQEKLSDLGLTTAEIFHDLSNIIRSICASQKATIQRLERIEKSVQEAKLWLEEDTFEDFFGDIIAEHLPESIASLEHIEEETERIDKLTERVREHLHLQFMKSLKKIDMLSKKGEEELNKSKIEIVSEDDFVLIDINNLVIECLNLGCKSGQNKKLQKGKSKLNLDLHIDVAPSVGKVKAHQENLRRILINLIDNAFYTVYEKKQRIEKLGKDYRPTISVSTKKLDDESVIITVEDNGEGIEMGFWEAMKPLITTKPKGEGTGLGLSIVEKLCQESRIKLNAKTDPGNFTRFTLTLQATYSEAVGKGEDKLQA